MLFFELARKTYPILVRGAVPLKNAKPYKTITYVLYNCHVLKTKDGIQISRQWCKQVRFLIPSRLILTEISKLVPFKK